MLWVRVALKNTCCLWLWQKFQQLLWKLWSESWEELCVGIVVLGWSWRLITEFAMIPLALWLVIFFVVVLLSEWVCCKVGICWWESSKLVNSLPKVVFACQKFVGLLHPEGMFILTDSRVLIAKLSRICPHWVWLPFCCSSKSTGSKCQVGQRRWNN